MKEFSSFHPFVIFFYFSAVIFFTMFLTHPIFLVISLFISIIFLIKTISFHNFKSKLLYISIFFIIVTIANPIFVHKGETALFFVNDNAITLEAIIYGVAFACLLVSIIFWFQSFNKIVDSDKLIYIFSSFIPTIGLIIAMALRFIPRFQNHFNKVIEINKIGDNPYKSNKYMVRIKALFNVFSILVTWAFENSIETANTMKARGYGSGNRSSFNLYKFDFRDSMMLISLIFLVLLNIFFYFNIGLSFYYYPTIANINFDYLSIIAYISYLLLLALPLIFEVLEEYRWKLLISKI